MRSYSAQKTIPTRTRSKAVQMVVSVEAPTARFDSQGCQVDAHPRPRVAEAGLFSSTSSCHSWRQLSCCRGRRTRSGYWDLRPPAAAGGRPGSMCRLLEACSSTPEPLRHRRPCVPCRRRPYAARNRGVHTGPRGRNKRVHCAKKCPPTNYQVVVTEGHTFPVTGSVNLPVILQCSLTIPPLPRVESVSSSEEIEPPRRRTAQDGASLSVGYR